MSEVGSASNANGAPVLVQANANILDLILRFIHPGLVNPVVTNVTTLGSLFKVAKQYEMDGMRGILQHCFLNPVHGSTRPLFKTEPLTSLAIAIAFECREVERLALIEVIKGEVEETTESSEGFDIPVRVLQRIQALKENRVDRYLEKIIGIGLNIAVTAESTRIHAESRRFINNLEPPAATVTPTATAMGWLRTAKTGILKQPTAAKFREVVFEAVERRLISSESVWRMIQECEEEAIGFESGLSL